MRANAISRIAIIAVAAVAVLTGGCAKAVREAPALPVDAIGARDGASYRIDIPKNWNHELIVYYHGYQPRPIVFEKGRRNWPAVDALLAKGYAVIQSGYSRGGWAVEQAYAETEALRRDFVATYGRPVRSWVMGDSMGGALTALTMETRPQVYAGALALCGAIEPSNRILGKAFAMRAAFDYYFPDLLGPLVPVPDTLPDFETMRKRVATALEARPAARDALLRLSGVATAKSFPDIVAFVTQVLQELQQRTHGNPFGNADLIYTGSGDDYALNDGVRRYRADAQAAAYVARWYTPTGALLRPMLTLHDTGDPLVPAGDAFEYALIAERAGHADNFVQQYVNREGHCVFEPAEVTRAFDELVDWVGTGKRPVPGKLP
ncbi:MAG: alpha/beta hydrolase [Rudaea sp.]|uniref:alpha/beta hydrolase n=1 Tax=Rudaea sp. TaxID=2136325 RepID=UPI0039E46A71